ncbi:MAG: F0F1 ATP synthase subunit C [Candidatus Dependentiae bacterium ADurb.Bin331]|nr:MAG: F0F1 ATP synthase subunit C [Candidatus Dependentiae bacterium ADurb.Bin331]
MIDPALLHYMSIAIVIVLTTVGATVGSIRASKSALDAINIAPAAKNEITRASVIGLALIETAPILGLILILMLLLVRSTTPTLPVALAELGIALGMGITGFIGGIVSAYPTQETCFAIARQPFFSQNLLNLMVITQTIIQTPLIFVFLVSLFIFFQLNLLVSIKAGLILMASGLCMGIGSVGPSIGLGRFARTACKSVGINRKAYSYILPFTLMSGAFIETPLIFAFLVSLILLGNILNTDPLIGIRSICAALCIGFGTFAPGINSSKTASSACQQMALNPSAYSSLSQISMFSQGIIDAAAIYALLTALFIVLLK